MKKLQLLAIIAGLMSASTFFGAAEPELDWAQRQAQEVAFNAVRRRDWAQLREILQAGLLDASLNMEYGGMLLLHRVLSEQGMNEDYSQEQVGIVNELIQRGADPNQLLSGYSAIGRISLYGPNSRAVFRGLVERGARLLGRSFMVGSLVGRLYQEILAELEEAPPTFEEATELPPPYEPPATTTTTVTTPTSAPPQYAPPVPRETRAAAQAELRRRREEARGLAAARRLQQEENRLRAQEAADAALARRMQEEERQTEARRQAQMRRDALRRRQQEVTAQAPPPSSAAQESQFERVMRLQRERTERAIAEQGAPAASSAPPPSSATTTTRGSRVSRLRSRFE